MAAQGYVNYRAVPAVDTTIDLTSTFRSLQVWTDSGAADVYLTFNDQVAVVGGSNTIKIQAGAANGYKSPDNVNLAISKIHIIGASALGNINVVAN